MARGELILAGIFGALGLFWVVESLKLPYWSGFAPSQGFLPLWVGAILLGLVLAFLIGRWRAAPSLSPPGLPAPAGAEREAAAARKPAWITLGLVVCVAALEPLGFVLPVGLYLLFLMLVVERRPWMPAAAVAGGATAALYLLFAVWLGVPLPRGPWGY